MNKMIFEIGSLIMLPSNLCITVKGLETLKYKLVSWKVLDNYIHPEFNTERIVLRYRNLEHDCELTDVCNKISFLKKVKK